MLQKTSDKSLRRDDTKSDARIADSGKSPGVPALGFIASERRERSGQGINAKTKKPATRARLRTLCQSNCTERMIMCTTLPKSRVRMK